MWKRWNTSYGLENQKEIVRMLGDAFCFSEVDRQVVMDAGTGQGRFVRALLDNGVKIVVCTDLGASVELAYEKYQDDERMVCVQVDLYKPAVRPIFDLVMCLGVMQHLPDPRLAFQMLLSLIKPGGQPLIWCYGQSSLRVPLRLLRGLATRLPLGITWALAFMLAVPRHIIHQLCLLLERTGLSRLAQTIPFSAYEEYDFKMFHVNTFDHLSAKVIYFFPRSDIEKWLPPDEGVCTAILGRHQCTASASRVVDARKPAGTQAPTQWGEESMHVFDTADLQSGQLISSQAARNLATGITGPLVPINNHWKYQRPQP